MTGTADPQTVSAWIQRSVEEIKAFTTEEVLATFQEALTDDATWQSAQKDPEALLQSKNIAVPETIKIAFEEQAASGDQPARRCLRIYRNEPPPDPGAPPIIWGYELCFL